MNHRAGIAGIVLALFLSLGAPCLAADQDLLVANLAFPFSIARFDGVTGTSAGPGTTFASDASMSFPRAIVYGPDGHLYVANEGTGDIQKYDGVTGALISTFIPGSYGVLETPKGIVFDSTGDHLIVTSHDAPNSLLRYDAITGAYVDDLFASLPGGVSIGAPWGVAIGPDGDIFCSGEGTSNILRFDGATGAYVSEFVPPGGSLASPHGITFGPDGDLYVAEFDVPSRIRKYDGDTGASLGVFVSSGSGGLSRADFLVFGPDGNLYVSSGDTANVLRYNGTTGAFMDVFASGAGLTLPSGLTFTPIPEPTSAVLALATAAMYARPRARG